MRYSEISNSGTAPPNLTGKPSVSKLVIGPIPLLPAFIPSQVESTEAPSGESIPRPVITTRRLFIWYLQLYISRLIKRHENATNQQLAKPRKYDRMRCLAMINMVPPIKAHDTIQKTLITGLKGFPGLQQRNFRQRKSRIRRANAAFNQTLTKQTMCVLQRNPLLLLLW